MKNCDSCGRSPDRCVCTRVLPDRFDCKACGHRAGRQTMKRIDDARGFISHWLCKNLADCAVRQQARAALPRP